MAIPHIRLECNPRLKSSERETVENTEAIVRIFRTQWDPELLEIREQCKVLYLKNTAVIGIYEVSLGGSHKTAVNTRLIFTAALKAGANRIVLAHNHAGDYAGPSKVDIKTTDRVRRVGELIGVTLMDHIILTAESHYSFWEIGMLKIGGFTRQQHLRKRGNHGSGLRRRMLMPSGSGSMPLTSVS